MDILEGYWYSTEEKLNSNCVRDCMQVKIKTKAPPYLVVNKSIKSIILSGSWPGELWCVRIQELGDMSNLVGNPHYWRANAILLLERIDISELFGAYGERIVGLLAQIQSLSLGQVDKFQYAKFQNASEAYLRAWKAWNDKLVFPRNADLGSIDNNLLGMPYQRDNEMSPINHGFMQISYLIDKRARELEGDNAFISVKDAYSDDMETVLTDKWSKTTSAFLFAAMALGAPDYIMQEDYESLISA